MCEISTHVTNIYDNNYYFIIASIAYNHAINGARICDYQNQNPLLRESQEAAYTCNRILCQLANSRGTVQFPCRCMLIGTVLYDDYV